MNPKSFMVIAGEASGDMLAAELVRALRQEVKTLKMERDILKKATAFFANLHR